MSQKRVFFPGTEAEERQTSTPHACAASGPCKNPMLMDGSTTLLERMIAGDWREDFLVTEPGQEISFEQFMVDGGES
jgi:hypothetical protein